jgi:predicted nuclease of predicted toxin-antitoxin system
MATSSCPRTGNSTSEGFLLGHPPKVVWIRRGNCSTRDIETLLRDRLPDLLGFDADPGASFLALS